MADPIESGQQPEAEQSGQSSVDYDALMSEADADAEGRAWAIYPKIYETRKHIQKAAEWRQKAPEGKHDERAVNARKSVAGHEIQAKAYAEQAEEAAVTYDQHLAAGRTKEAERMVATGLNYNELHANVHKKPKATKPQETE